ncbi:MAG: M23 family metallopeptidase [Prevotellaceae bacterium]|jgi:murein DD-endopeptidase MepM/ murein hydrolase activator NlpD|nr:M23 family metallopeptidase [Prevotellaceae bacterium]
MAKAKFHFNPKTLTYERIDNTIRHKIKKLGSHLITSILSGLACFVAFAMLFESPREKMLRSENAQLEAQYEFLYSQLDQIQEVMTDMQQRDDNLYRVIVQAEPVASSIRNSITESSSYRDLRRKTNSELAVSTTQKLSSIRRQLYVQSHSFDEIVDLAKNKEERLLCMPAIQPVLNKDLKRVASGYGTRIDPIYKTPKFHAGMDFTGAPDTEIFATGKGVVEAVGWMQGYGNTVIVNHGFNYKTLYAHLNKFKVKKGAKVNRGDVVGLMGNTGKSTGVHLHYEVQYKGKQTNPQNYYFMDLNPEEYDQMVQLSSNYGHVFD